MRRCVVAIAALAMAMLFCGCAKKERSYVVPGGKAKVKTEKSLGGEKTTVEVQTKEGKATYTAGEKKSVSEAELGVPVYPGAKVQMSGQYEGPQTGSEGKVSQYQLTTDASFEDVVKFYKSRLKDVKGSYTHAQGDQKMAMFSVGEKAKRTVHIIADAEKKQTIIQVIKQGE